MSTKPLDTLSNEELSKLCTGADFWHSYGVEHCNIPAMMMSDGPHGLRKQSDKADHLGVNDSITAICFPTAGSVAASFDKELAYNMGRLLGIEARAEGVHILLGPAINIKRTPLCGRNFEYFSEDPYLTGVLASEMVRGIQSVGVGACVKHYAANNQEKGRMTISAEIDQRTLREIYLSAFRMVVEQKPAAIMSSYNRVNGEYVGESKTLLTDILRNEWGFDGIVISDWFAVNDRVKSLLAGLDLEMPGSAIAGAKVLQQAANQDDNVRQALITSATRIANTAQRLVVSRTAPYNLQQHHDKAVHMATECAVLLKNDGIFPLTDSDRVLLVGKLAQKPRFQGGGSSHINAYQVDSVVDNINNATYMEVPSDNFAQELSKISANYDKIIVFADIANEYESEGYDRTNLSLSQYANETIDTVANSGVACGVVLCNGSPITMPWLDSVNGVLLMGLCGEGLGKACAKILTGQVNPSGRLAESYPIAIEHTPAYINSRGVDKVHYAEGVFVGYRYYSTKKLPTLFPFGYGLSYTKYQYSNLTVNLVDNQLHITVNVKNIGNMAGKETVQLYIAPPTTDDINRPSIELRGFDKIALDIGEEKTASFVLDNSQLAYYNCTVGDWIVQSGQYRVIIGRSAEEEICSMPIDIVGDMVAPIIDDNVTIGQLINYPPTSQLVSGLIAGYSTEAEGGAIGQQMKQAMLYNSPLRLVKGVAKLDDTRYNALLDKLRSLAGQ